MSVCLFGASLIDCTGKAIQKDMAVGIKNNRITYVGPTQGLITKEYDTAIDATGKYILPGLINMHEHLTFKDMKGPPAANLQKSAVSLMLHAEKMCKNSLKKGITTVREMGSPYYIGLEMRNAITGRECAGPRILSCGKPISATGGHFSQIAEIADGEDQVRKEARMLLTKGVDIIKVMASHDPYPMPGFEQTRSELSEEEIRAAYAEAHKWGKKTACHVLGKKSLKNVIAAGADVIDHGAYMDDEIAFLAAEKGVYYTPTLSSYTRQTVDPKLNRGAAWIAKHEVLIQPFYDAFCAALKAGVKMVCGTDSVGVYAQEVELFRELGMTPMDSLLSCTKLAAEALGLEDRIGTLECNKLADIVVLEADPLDDPYALEKVFCVIMEGDIIDLTRLEL